MTTTELYTTPERVRRLMRLPTAFSSSTNPTDEQVKSLIEGAMATIDEVTGQVFRLWQNQEYKNLDYDYWRNGGSRVPLANRNIVTPLSAAAGDSLKLWDGTAWTEWVGVETEARSGDFWIDEREGVLHILNRGQLTPYKLIDIKYRFNNGARALLNDASGINASDTAITIDNVTGVFPYQGWITIDDEEIRYSSVSSTTITANERGAFSTTAASHSDDAVITFVPADISEACTMLVAANLLTSEDWSSGGMNSGDIPGAQMPVVNKAEEWRKRAFAILRERFRKSWMVV